MRLMKSVLVGATLLFGFVTSISAQDITVNVVDQDGVAVSGFKWVLEEDNTHAPQPGEHLAIDPTDVNNNTLGVSIHKSHAHVLASGESLTDSVFIDNLNGDTLPDGRYFVSVLPYGDRNSCDGTYDMGGSPADTSDGEVTVYVRQHPVETAQIAVKVFHDIAPLNNAPDIPELATDEFGVPLLPMAGFTVTLAEQGGDIVQDGFGNILGTTYVRDGEGNAILDENCEPSIDEVGTGDFVTPPNGELFIKNLRPGKYAVQVEPPAGDPGWFQTTTIEGSKTIDAWVRPNEPPFLVEFGPPIWHTFYGFVKEMNTLPPPGDASGTITGTVRKAHLSHPPAIAFFNGPPPEAEGVGERCLIGLNRLEAGFAEAVWVGKCEDGTGEFEIIGVPPGTYQVVIWDMFLLQIISFQTAIVPDGGGLVAMGDIDGNIPVPMWFGIQEHNVYFDANKNANRDPGEVGILEQGINLRFRDGTIYSAFPTDLLGFVPFQEVFPFFHWQIAEVDFTRFQATGVEMVIDDGGPVTHDDYGEGKRNPQAQGAGGDPSRTDRGRDVLLEGYQTFAGQNLRFEWGKANYDTADINIHPFDDFPGPGDTDACDPAANTAESVPAQCTGGTDGEYNNNGGISGVIFYATTRAEDNPRFAAGEEWEPGVPHVQVALYRDDICNSNGGPAIYPLCPEAIAGEFGDGIPDDRVAEDGTVITLGVVTYADVDNYPLDNFPGPEDTDWNLDTFFDNGDAIRVITSDSWDDDQPQGCEGDGVHSPVDIHGDPVLFEQCAEGLRTWNQVRPALFDGGYAFPPGDLRVTPGTYIVDVATPPGMKTVKEEDRNVDFGNIPIPALLPSRCVGDERVVPDLFSFLTDEGGSPLPGVDVSDPDNEAPFAGDPRNLCDRKSVTVKSGQNAAADFFLFTDVPKAARGVGIITDDFANEIAPGKPEFTEKFSPPWISVAVFDYTGNEIQRTYGDEFGHYNFLAPSHYNVNPPTPSGIEAKMHQFCLNHPGPIAGTGGSFIIDPLFRKQYSTTCYQFNFETGRVIYLDTPVIRQAAFVGALQQTLDCEAPDETPGIFSVINMDTGEPATVRAGETLEIVSLGRVDVRNPDFPGDANTDGIPDDPPTEDEFVRRDYRFGSGVGGPPSTPSGLSIGDYEFANGDVSWTPNRVRVTIPVPLPSGLASGQLTLINDGTPTQTAVTVTIADGPGGVGGGIIRVACDAGGGQFCTGSIQDAIDGASDGDLILVDPGIYAELPIMYKRVKLQGAGAGSTSIWASHYSAGPGFANPVIAWRDKIDDLVGSGDLGLLPEQDPGTPDLFLKDGEAPGIFVSPNPGVFNTAPALRDDLSQRARIDGFNISLADLGGAIYVNAYANRLLISNNGLKSNAGNLGGGIRVGNPAMAAFARGGVPVETSPNPDIDIRYNDINQNGSRKMGGGASIFKGATDYRIRENKFCGNFARSGGGAIAHRGLSDNGTIAMNRILFNEVFQGDQPGAGLGIGGGGGGIEIAGDPDAAGGLTEGAGDVVINQNLIQGNLGGAADGGGIALRNVNGDDVAGSSDPNDWWLVGVFNNLIVNNVSGLGGGGIGLQDAARVQIIHNTIAHNDSTATGTFAFTGGPNVPTTPQPAGIVSRDHSIGLQAFLGEGSFSDPVSLRRNILSENRTFRYDNNADPGLQLEPNPAGAIWDLGVVGSGSDCLSPTQAVLTDIVPTADPSGCSYAGDDNIPLADVGFIDDYFNTLITAAAADEGGNFVQVYYTPLGLTGDYHLGDTSLAIDLLPLDSFIGGLLAEDVDDEARFGAGAGPDTGADEVQP